MNLFLLSVSFAIALVCCSANLLKDNPVTIPASKSQESNDTLMNDKGSIGRSLKRRNPTSHKHSNRNSNNYHNFEHNSQKRPKWERAIDVHGSTSRSQVYYGKTKLFILTDDDYFPKSDVSSGRGNKKAHIITISEYNGLDTEGRRGYYPRNYFNKKGMEGRTHSARRKRHKADHNRSNSRYRYMNPSKGKGTHEYKRHHNQHNKHHHKGRKGSKGKGNQKGSTKHHTHHIRNGEGKGHRGYSYYPSHKQGSWRSKGRENRSDKGRSHKVNPELTNRANGHYRRNRNPALNSSNEKPYHREGLMDDDIEDCTATTTPNDEEEISDMKIIDTSPEDSMKSEERVSTKEYAYKYINKKSRTNSNISSPTISTSRHGPVVTKAPSTKQVKSPETKKVNKTKQVLKQSMKPLKR